MENVYIALIINLTEGFDLSQYDLVINLFNTQYPNNKLIFDEHLVDGTTDITNLVLYNFLQKYPSGKRVTISTSTAILLDCSNYMNNNNLDIINLSLDASVNNIQNINNIITYGYFNQYQVMSIILTFIEYQMNEIHVLYQQNTTNDVFLKDFLNQVNIQSSLLNINVITSFLEAGKSNYNIKPKSLIIILGVTADITNIYITPEFLYNIPKNCYIIMSNFNNTITDIFGNIPAIVEIPSPINYTITTQNVYNAIKNNPNGYSFRSYSLYDILFVLNSFTNNNLPITIDNYINANPYDLTPPANLLNSDISKVIKGVPYGNFYFIFTKNVIINKDQDLFIKYYKGGQSNLPDSYSIFRIAGITYDNESLINYDQANYYKIYDKFNNKIVVRFNSDKTLFPVNNISEINNNYLNIGITNQTKFIYEYNEQGYFTVLERFVLCSGYAPEVNPTMSKIPIKLKYCN